MQKEKAVRPGMWHTTKGQVQIDSMTDDHIQAALAHAEMRFKKYTEKALSYADFSTMVWDKILELTAEAERRKLHVISLSQKDPEKYAVIRNTWNLELANNS